MRQSRQEPRCPSSCRPLQAKSRSKRIPSVLARRRPRPCTVQALLAALAFGIASVGLSAPAWADSPVIWVRVQPAEGGSKTKLTFGGIKARPSNLDPIWGICPPSAPELLADPAQWHIYKETCQCSGDATSEPVPCRDFDRSSCRFGVWTQTDATTLVDIPYEEFNYSKLCSSEWACLADASCESYVQELWPAACVVPKYEDNGEDREAACGVPWDAGSEADAASSCGCRGVAASGLPALALLLFVGFVSLLWSRRQ